MSWSEALNLWLFQAFYLFPNEVTGGQILIYSHFFPYLIEPKFHIILFSLTDLNLSLSRKSGNMDSFHIAFGTKMAGTQRKGSGKEVRLDRQHNDGFNSLAPGRFGSNFKSVIFKLILTDWNLEQSLWNCLQVNATSPRWRWVNIGSESESEIVYSANVQGIHW